MCGDTPKDDSSRKDEPHQNGTQQNYPVAFFLMGNSDLWGGIEDFTVT